MNIWAQLSDILSEDMFSFYLVYGFIRQIIFYS